MKKFTVLSILIITGCLSYPADIKHFTSSPDEVSKDTEILNSDFEPFVRIHAPTLQKVVGASVTTYRLRGFRGKNSGKMTHQLYVHVVYNLGDWRFYNKITGFNGVPLNFVVINRRVSNCNRHTCSYEEILGADLELSKSDIANGPDGLHVRMSARNGANEILFVPWSYISGYLNAVNSIK